MAQHDYNLSNNTGALFRQDLNSAMQAIVTMNSGAGAPTVTFPGMLWLDLSGGGDGVMRRRNQANTAWLTDIGQDQVARNAAAAAQATADAAMPKAGGTFTGPINLPGTVPTNNQALSRAQADLLYQVVLPATQAGALLYGLAGGWTGVLPPAANDTVLVLSGGLPTWAAGAVTAVPNAYVRTRSDGTIDPTLIPSVASGLRFRGTFKPAVNAEYPTTGGSGSGGAPAVGDFWVIDGLTTGGYTYLTGSLAGVTVYNGDSIAKSDGASWYRMGSSVELEGYLKADGSVAMTGNLNMGAHNIINIAGLTARAGPAVPLSNFSLDATNIIISPQRGTTGADLPALATGQLGTDLGRMQIVVGAGSGNTNLLAVPWFSATNAYAIGDYVRQGTALYRAKVAVSAGAFTASQWSRVMDQDYGAFNGTVTGSSFGTAVGTLSGWGNVYLQRGGASAPGYVDFTGPDDTRWGYIGSNDGTANNILFTGSNGKGISINGAQLNIQCAMVANQAITAKLGIVAQGTGTGSVNLVPGTATNPGYIEWRLPNNARTAYMGWLNTNASVTFLESGYNWNFDGATDSGGYRFFRPVQFLNFEAGYYTGPAGAQIGFASWGRNNAIPRFRWIMETNDTISAYTYDAAGGGARMLFNWASSNLGGQLSCQWGTNVHPIVDNVYACGVAGARWASVWAAVGTIQTSDEREKSPFIPFTPDELKLGTDLIRASGSFHWLADEQGGGVIKRRFGFGAQTANQIMQADNITPDEVAITTFDTWPASPDITDPDTGAVVQPGIPAGDRYGANYDQAFMLMIASLDARLLAVETTLNPPPPDTLQ